MAKPKFLDKVIVKKFAYGEKATGLDGRKVRIVRTKPNKEPDKIFTIVGCSHLNLGYSFYIGIQKYFCTTGRKQVFIVANKLNERLKVLPEDLEIVNESGVA